MSETEVILEDLLLILSVASFVAILVKRIHVPYTTALVLVGTGVSFLPVTMDIHPVPLDMPWLWGGLKGSIPMALVLGLPRDVAFRAEFLVLTVILVFFSLLVQTMTMKPLVKAVD